MSSVFNYIITFFEVYGIACMIGVLFVFFIGLWIGTAIENRKKKEDLKKPITKGGLIKIVLIMAVPVCCTLFITNVNPNYFGYGYANDDFSADLHEGNLLWGIDEYRTSSGKSRTVVIYRIQCLDLKTGKRQFKKLIDDDLKIEGKTPHIVWATIDEELTGLDINTGKAIKTINKKTLQQTIPGLSGGVHEYKYNQKTSLIDIVSEEGEELSIDPATGLKVISPAEKDNRAEMDKKYISDTSGTRIITLYNEGERQRLGNENKEVINKGLFFLKGQFIQYDTLLKQAFTFSYEKLDETNFIIRALSLGGKLLWEAKQDTLKIGDFFESQPRFLNAFFYEEALIVVTDGFVFSLNKANGNLNWLTRM